MNRVWRDLPIVERVHYGAVRARAWSRRATRPGLAVRAAVLVSGLGAAVVALPPPVRVGPLLLVAMLFAALSAAVPGGIWVAVLELGAVTAFVLGLAGGQHPAGLPEVTALAALLYLHHSASALGAMLRTDAVVPPAVLRRWAARTGAVLAGSAAAGLLVLAVAASAAPRWSGTAFVGLGVLGALAVAGTLTWLWRR